jgi:hypothetical protein
MGNSVCDAGRNEEGAVARSIDCSGRLLLPSVALRGLIGTARPLPLFIHPCRHIWCIACIFAVDSGASGHLALSFSAICRSSLPLSLSISLPILIWSCVDDADLIRETGRRAMISACDKRDIFL